MKRGIKAISVTSPRKGLKQVEEDYERYCSCEVFPDNYCSIPGHEFTKACKKEGIV